MCLLYRIKLSARNSVTNIYKLHVYERERESENLFTSVIFGDYLIYWANNMFWVGWFHAGLVGWRQTNNFLRMALLIKKCTSPSKVLTFCLFLLTLGVMAMYSLRIHVTRLCYNYWFWKYFNQVLLSTQTSYPVITKRIIQTVKLDIIVKHRKIRMYQEIQ